MRTANYILKIGGSGSDSTLETEAAGIWGWGKVPSQSSTDRPHVPCPTVIWQHPPQLRLKDLSPRGSSGWADQGLQSPHPWTQGSRWWVWAEIGEDNFDQVSQEDVLKQVTIGLPFEDQVGFKFSLPWEENSMSKSFKARKCLPHSENKVTVCFTHFNMWLKGHLEQPWANSTSGNLCFLSDRGCLLI